MNPLRLFAFKARLELYGEILARGDGLVPFNQESLLEVADELLAEIRPMASDPESGDLLINGCCVAGEGRVLQSYRDWMAEESLDERCQKVLLDDCLAMVEIIESHRKPALTPTKETPVTPPMTDDHLRLITNGLDTFFMRITGLTQVDYAEAASLHRLACQLLGEVERLRALPPASEVEVAVTALGNMLQEHLSDVTGSVKDCLQMASDVCDAIEDADDEAADDAGGWRLIGYEEIQARIQSILDAMYEQEDNTDGVVRVAYEGILRLQGWVDGKAEPATA